MKNLNALIFDMDGVIVDSEKLHMEAEKITCKKFGILAPPEAWESLKGTTAVRFFTTLIDLYGTGEAVLEEVMSYNSSLYLELAKENLELIGGFPEFIKGARERFGKIALATSGRRASQEFVFEKFGLSDYFDSIITGDDLSFGKPHPEPYEKSLSLLGVRPEEAVVIEDSDNGILSAKAAGCRAIGITTTFPREKLEEAGADYVFDSYSDIGAFLLGWPVNLKT